MGQYPTMIGEIGIPFDLDRKKAYVDGDYSAHTKALDASLNACDGSNALNYTIWTYCPDNVHAWGDLWNGEDLSLWSSDDATRMYSHRSSNSHIDLVGKISSRPLRASSSASSINGSSPAPSSRVISRQTSSVLLSDGFQSSSPSVAPSSMPSSLSAPSPLPLLSLPLIIPSCPSPTSLPHLNLNDGARALGAFCRPYPLKAVGTPVDINFDLRSSVFTLSIRVDAGDVLDPHAATEIFVPLVHYAQYPSRIQHQPPSYNSSQVSLASVAETTLGREKNGYLSPYNATPYASKLSLPDESAADDPNALDIAVTVSAGHWDRTGEYLRWFYPRPETGSITVKIEIKRTNGAIPTWVSMTGAREFSFSAECTAVLTFSCTQTRTPKMSWALAKEARGQDCSVA